MEFNQHLDNLGAKALEWLLTSGVRILIILIGAILARKLLDVLARRIRHILVDGGTVTDQEKRTATLINLVRRVIRLFVLLTAVSMIMKELGMTIGPLLASAGIVGLAIGFGAQNLVRDVVSGFFILLENQYREGDVIRAAGVEGTVQTFRLRSTVLRDFQGLVHYVPNGEIRVVTNLTQDWSRAVIDVEVGYREDVDRICQLLQNLGDKLMNEPEFKGNIFGCEVLGVERLVDSAVVLRVALRVEPTQRDRVSREFRHRLLKAFAEAGIEIPYPQRLLIREERFAKVGPPA
jgi:small conductance mechanosensitive channel